MDTQYATSHYRFSSQDPIHTMNPEIYEEYVQISTEPPHKRSSSDSSKRDSYFEHLQFANQSYTEHFCDSITYCGKSLQASFYFLCHAIWPDVFQQSGSDTVHALSKVIRTKYKRRLEELEVLQRV